MSKHYTFTITGELYIIIGIVGETASFIGWENSEKAARKVVKDLHRFYPSCGKPMYIVIEKASKEVPPIIQQMWFERKAKKYVEFPGLRNTGIFYSGVPDDEQV